MDTLLTESALDSRIEYEKAWNIFRMKGSANNFLSAAGTFDINFSLLDPELISLHEELFQKIEMMSRDPSFNNIFDKLNPLKTYLDYRDQDKNGHYYSLLYQNLHKALLPQENGRVITNDIRPLHFYKENKAMVNYFFYVPRNSKKSRMTHDEKIIDDYPNLNPGTSMKFLIPMEQHDVLDWDEYEKREDVLQADLMVFRESEEGRDPNPMVEKRGPFLNFDDQYYQKEHFHTCIRSLYNLKEGGNVVVYFISLGAQHVADMVYFFANVFEEIEFYMPMASDFLSMEHCLIARGFKRDLYLDVTDENILLNWIEDWTPQFNYQYYPRFSKFENDQVFLEWIKDINNKMLNYQLSLMLSFVQGFEDMVNQNYAEVRFPYRLDPYKLKANLNLFKHLPISYNNVFEEENNFNVASRELALTSTGQITTNVEFPKELSMTSVNYRFCLYLSIQRITFDLHNDLNGYDLKESKIVSWFIDLVYEGLLDKILKASSSEEMKSYFKKWNYDDWYENAKLKKIEESYLKDVFNKLKEYVNGYYGQKERLTQAMTMKMFKTKTMKYRIQFTIKNRSYLLQSPSSSELVITQKELLGIIPSSYKTNPGFSLAVIDNWIKERGFIIRALNYLSFPLLSSYYSNSVAFYKYMKSVKVDFDLLASPWYRTGIHWSSFWDEDRELGALQQSEAFDPNNIYYRENSTISNFWLFPPQNEEIFGIYARKLEIFLKGRHENGQPTTLYLVYDKKISEINEEVDEIYTNLEEISSLQVTTVEDERKYEMITGRNYQRGYLTIASFSFD